MKCVCCRGSRGGALAIVICLLLTYLSTPVRMCPLLSPHHLISPPIPIPPIPIPSIPFHHTLSTPSTPSTHTSTSLPIPPIPSPSTHLPTHPIHATHPRRPPPTPTPSPTSSSSPSTSSAPPRSLPATSPNSRPRTPPTPCSPRWAPSRARSIGCRSPSRREGRWGRDSS